MNTYKSWFVKIRGGKGRELTDFVDSIYDKWK